MEEINKLLFSYADSYYNLDTSIVSDAEFDSLLNELKSLEKENPHLVSDTSYTLQVGVKVNNRFTKVQHSARMYSLDNAFSYEDLVEFDNKIKKEVANVTYVCELKIDGLAINIEYGENNFIAITRGDGVTGEDVTHNVETIKTLPKNIKNMQVRGEIFISKEEFNKINNSGEKKFANPRNLASGTMRQLDNKITSERNLDMFAYGLSNYGEYDLDTYYDAMMFLKDSGFKINEQIKLCNNIKEVYNYIVEITAKRDSLEYEIDGIVIKVNEYSAHDELGYTAKFPKWAIAYKFPSGVVTTKLNDIILTVGRTGKITPNAYLEPVELMGSVIAKATLHNHVYINDKDIRVGDYVEIIKAGDIIPRVEKVDITKRSEEIEKFNFPSVCPVCHSVLEVVENDHYCLNTSCAGRNLETLTYFASRDCMNIDGLGEAIIEKLIEHGFVKTYIDFYNITEEQLLTIEGFAELSAKNLVTAISNSLNNNVANFIASLGIKNLGLVSARAILKTYPNFSLWNTLSIEDFTKVDKVGEVIASEVFNYLNVEQNIIDITKVISLGLDPTIELIKVDESNLYFKKTIVITGTFEKYKRNDIKKVLETLGAVVTNSVSKKTDYLFTGSDAGSKLTKALDIGVTIVNEEQVNDIMEAN